MTTAAPIRVSSALHNAAPAANLVSSPAYGTDEFIPSGPVKTELVFYKEPEDGSDPYNYVEEPPQGVPRSNLRQEGKIVEIEDLRGQESEFSLDKQAFSTAQGVLSNETAFNDDEHIRAVYYPEVIDSVKKYVEGAKEVVIFDHTVRRNHPGAPRAPVNRVHIDQTPESGVQRIHQHLSPERAKEVIEKGERVRIINVWRPINGTVVDYPLAFADSSTVDEDNLVSVKHIYPDRTGATAGVKYSPKQRWWYWSGMRNDERLFIKCFDTDTTVGGGAPGKRGRVPHTAFVHSGTKEGSRKRESIEIRCLVVG